MLLKNVLSWCKWTYIYLWCTPGSEIPLSQTLVSTISNSAKWFSKVVVPISLLPVEHVFPLPCVLVTPSCCPSFSFLPFCWSVVHPHCDFILYLPAKFHVFIGHLGILCPNLLPMLSFRCVFYP